MNQSIISELEIPVGTAVLNCGNGWEIEEVNTEFCNLFGYTKEEFGAIPDKKSLICGKDAAAFEETLKRVVRDRRICECEMRIYRKDRSLHWIQTRCSFSGVKNSAPYVTVVLWDIHKQKTIERNLKLMNQKYELIEEVTKEIPFDVDVENWKMLHSRHFQKLCGEPDGEDRFLSFSEGVRYIHPLDQDGFVKAMKAAASEKKSGKIDCRINIGRKHEAHNYVWFRTVYRSIAGEEDRVIRIIGRCYNIDRDKMLQDEVRRDSLTKLLNKIEVQREVQRVIDEDIHGSHVMFLIDIDNFKAINDTFGHTFGDTVISDTAKQIREQFRSGDIAGRVGGDEFLVFMKDVSLEKAEEKAKVLCDSLVREYTGNDVTLKISISIGLSVLGRDGNSFHELFEKADHAMYRAKEAGKAGFQVAKKGDVGPVRTVGREVEKRESMSQQDREFLVFAVGLMTHARNIDGSLNLLLKRIAERFRLDLVTLFENKSDQQTMTLTNYYSDIFCFYENAEFPRSDPEIEEMEPGDLTVLHRDCTIDENMLHLLLNEDKRKLAGQKSVIAAGKYEYLGERTGVIFYISQDENRQWEKNELDLMNELTRMISIFVSLRYRMDESKAELLRVQKRDQLTGLYNFEAFKSKAREIFGRADDSRIYAVEYLDIDNFGYVNDNYGYQVGDNALKMFAKDTMNQPFYEVGCRLYSDFFVLLISDESKEAMAKHIYAHHQRFANMQNHQYPSSSMGVSSGVFIMDRKHADMDQAVENANLAWKNAKQQRRKEAVFFSPELRKSRSEEQQIIGEFYEALYRDDFRMYLQPKFVLGRQQIYGAEALARWQKPDGELLAPGAFLEPLERIGYVTELDFYIFEELLKTMSRWQKQKRPQIIVSTNFSGRHFEGMEVNF